MPWQPMQVLAFTRPASGSPAALLADESAAKTMAPSTFLIISTFLADDFSDAGRLRRGRNYKGTRFRYSSPRHARADPTRAGGPRDPDEPSAGQRARSGNH